MAISLLSFHVRPGNFIQINSRIQAAEVFRLAFPHTPDFLTARVIVSGFYDIRHIFPGFQIERPFDNFVVEITLVFSFGAR
jgi:hypothetical protein